MFHCSFMKWCMFACVACVNVCRFNSPLSINFASVNLVTSRKHTRVHTSQSQKKNKWLFHLTASIKQKITVLHSRQVCWMCNIITSIDYKVTAFTLSNWGKQAAIIWCCSIYNFFSFNLFAALVIGNKHEHQVKIDCTTRWHNTLDNHSYCAKKRGHRN